MGGNEKQEAFVWEYYQEVRLNRRDMVNVKLEGHKEREKERKRERERERARERKIKDNVYQMRKWDN